MRMPRDHANIRYMPIREVSAHPSKSELASLGRCSGNSTNKPPPQFEAPQTPGKLGCIRCKSSAVASRGLGPRASRNQPCLWSFRRRVGRCYRMLDARCVVQMHHHREPQRWDSNQKLHLLLLLLTPFSKGLSLTLSPFD